MHRQTHQVPLARALPLELATGAVSTAVGRVIAARLVAALSWISVSVDTIGVTNNVNQQRKTCQMTNQQRSLLYSINGVFYSTVTTIR